MSLAEEPYWTALIIAALFQSVLASGRSENAGPRNARGGGLTRHPSTNSAPAGATDAGTKLDGMGTGAGPVPLVRTAGGGDGCRRCAPCRSSLAEPQRNELRRVARLHPHEDRTLAVLLRVLERTADVGRIGNLLAADLENDVAGLDALVGGNSVGIDLGNHHAFRAAAGDLAGGYDREAEPRHVGALRAGGVGHRRRARLTLVRQFTECDGEGLLLALAPYRQFRGGAWRHAADLPGEVSGVFDRGAVDRRDHVPGHDAGFGGRAIRLRLGDQRALRGLETEIVGDFGGDGLDLHADPAAADLAVVLELSNDRLHGRSGDGKGDAYRAARGGEDGA